jgi:hypothetical protein
MALTDLFLVAALLCLPLLAAQVAGGPSAPPNGHEDVRASLLVLPLKGFLLLTVISLPALRGVRYVPQRTTDHVLLFFEVLLLLGMAGALLAGFAIDGVGNLGRSKAVPAALAVLGVHTFAFVRYYGCPLRLGASIGLGLSLLSVASWYTFATLDAFARLETMDMLEYVLPVLVLLLVAMLGVQTYKLHLRPRLDEGALGADHGYPWGVPATGVGTYSELLVANLGLAAVLLATQWWT